MKYVIVRTYSAGVFAGNLKSRNGQQVVLNNARRIWYWDGAASLSLSQLAMEGTSNPKNCKFPCEIKRVELLQAIEILYVTKKTEKSIKEVPAFREPIVVENPKQPIYYKLENLTDNSSIRIETNFKVKHK